MTFVAACKGTEIVINLFFLHKKIINLWVLPLNFQHELSNSKDRLGKAAKERYCKMSGTIVTIDTPDKQLESVV